MLSAPRWATPDLARLAKATQRPGAPPRSSPARLRSWLEEVGVTCEVDSAARRKQQVSDRRGVWAEGLSVAVVCGGCRLHRQHTERVSLPRAERDDVMETVAV